MKKLTDILIFITIALLLASFFLKGWYAVVCAVLAAIVATFAFFQSKKGGKS